MLKKKKLLCTAITCLAVGGFACSAGAQTTLTQADFTTPANGVNLNNNVYTLNDGTYVINTGEIVISDKYLDLSSNGVTITVDGNVGGNVDNSDPSNITGNAVFDIGELNITAGNIIATGNNATSAVGYNAAISSNWNLKQSGGSITLTGGAGDLSTAMTVGGDYHLSGGALYTEGGSGSASAGMVVGNNINSPEEDFYQTGGTVTAKGGAGANSSGAFVYGSVGLSAGSMDATGGAGTDAHGIESSNHFIQLGGTLVATGSATANGGAGVSATGVVNLRNGNMAAYGGAQGTSGITSYMFEQQGGNITAVGGATQSAGIKTDTSFTQQGGSVNAVAGADTQAYGIYTDTYSQTGGAINATGGNANGGTNAGVYAATSFTQSGASVINANGGGANTTGQTAGVWVNGTFNQNQGTVNATGGADNAYGFYAQNFTQASGSEDVWSYFNAYGGSGTNAYGLYINGPTATIGDEFLAMPGSGANAYGAYFIGNLTVASPWGVLEYGHNAAAPTNAAVKVGGNLDLQAGSWLSPIINSTTGEIGFVEAGTVNIDAGAQLMPRLSNAITLSEGTVITVAGTGNFLTSTGGLTGDFGNVIGGQVTSLFYTYDVVKGANDYAITQVTVTNSIANVSSSLGENARDLLLGSSTGLANAAAAGVSNGTTALLNDIFDELMLVNTLEEFQALAATAQLALTNHASTRLAHYSMQQLDVVQASLNREMTYAQRIPYWQAWAKGIYHTGDVKAKTFEFVKGEDEFVGIVFGAARDFRYVTFAGQAHYLSGTVKSKNVYKADTDTFGFIVGARVHDVVNPKGVFNPWFDINFAYSYMDTDQNRTTLGYNIMGGIDTVNAHSNAKSNVFRLGLAMGNTFDMGGFGTITPQVGFDYTYYKQDGYRESGLLGLKTKDSTFESLRPKVGAEAEIYLSEFISANLRAFYYYETMDQRMVYQNSFAGAPMVKFKTRGEKLDRSSGNLGVGVNVAFSEQMSAGVNYDLWLRDKYTAHQFALELRYNF